MDIINKLRYWNSALLIFAIIPIIFLGTILIVYGVQVDFYFIHEDSIFKLLRPSSLERLFDRTDQLPIVVKAIALFSLKLLNVLFYTWLLSDLTLSYYVLSRKTMKEILLVMKLIIVTILFFVFFAPSNLILFVLGCAIIALEFIMIMLYWIYRFRTKR